MRKLLFTAATALAIVALGGSALASGLCSVTVTADCKVVTVKTHVPKGEGGHTAETLTLDSEPHSFEFDGVDDARTFEHPGSVPVQWDAMGTVTNEGRVKPFHFSGTAERSGDCSEPSPSPKPSPQPTHGTQPPPPLAGEGGPPKVAYTGMAGWVLQATGALLIVAAFCGAGLALDAWLGKRFGKED